MEEATTQTIQLEIEERATKKLRKVIDNLSASLYNGESGDCVREKTININIGSAEKPNVKPLHILFEKECYGQIIFQNNINKYIENETRLFLKEVKTNKQAPTLPLPEVVVNPKITERITEKQKELQYLDNFLSTCYKGSDAKQKVERELSVINAEIKALQFALPITDDLPY